MSSTTKKSGLRKLKQSEVLFEDGADANSLFIIQKGQIRLYKPKGKGFVEIAVLRPGEVLGEMAYFVDDGKGQTRSCAAAALTPSEVIEVSFEAFSKTIKSLNPWFQTIFTTLANRLRTANGKIKQLENNSVSMGYGANQAGYKFFQSTDVIKVLSVLFLTMSAHGEKKAGGYALHSKTISFYAQDIFNIQEVKLIEFMNLLRDLDLAVYQDDEKGNPQIFIVRDVQMLRGLMVFFNTQRVTADEKQIRISARCELFLDRILKKIDEDGVTGDHVTISLVGILAEFEEKKLGVDVIDLEDAKKYGYVNEPVIGENGRLDLTVNLPALRKSMACITVMNAVDKFNEAKQSGKYS